MRANADVAINTSLDALRKLLTDDSWLLDLPSSQARADTILLGYPRESDTESD